MNTHSVTSPSPRRARRSVNPITWGLLAAFLIAASITAYLTYVTIRDMTAAWNFTQLEGATVYDNQPTSTPNAQGTIAPSTILQPESGPTPQPWDGASRINILVMGLDYGDWSADREGPSRTDTMILFTIDPLTRTAGWLHIPRDMWVNVPGFGYYKINQAYYFGEGAQLPGGGPGLAMKTVEQFIGVPVDFYAQVDFSAFEQVIDEIGGIDIDVPMIYDEDGNPLKVFKIDPIGHHNTIKLTPGQTHHFDGPAALAYARNRYTTGGDFDRAARQKQVILAIRKKILEADMLPTLINRSGALYQELSAGIHTNMSLEQAIQLAWLLQQIPESSLKQGIIGPPDQVSMGTAVDQEGNQLAILIPVPNKIRELRDEIFTASGPVSPVAAESDLATLMQQEGARVSVLNASSTTGLAATTSEFLKSQGINVTFTDNANELYNATVIIDYTGKPYTVKFLMEVMNLPNAKVYSSYDPNSTVDVAVKVGADWAGSNPMP